MYWGTNPERIRASYYLVLYILMFSFPLMVYIFKFYLFCFSLKFFILDLEIGKYDLRI